MEPSLARSLFEQIQSLDEKARGGFLNNLITEKTFETDYLEFKGCLKHGKLLPNPEIREHYGKALSAFANTGGGVLVWGVNASRDLQTGVDCAQSPALAPNARELYSLLDVAERDATNPPVLGVVKFPVITGGTQGFVVSFIPESRFKPHARRMEGKDEFYYMRVSSHSIQAEHSTLRRLFFPEYHCYLRLFFQTTFVATGVNALPVLQVDIFLHNRGPGTADDVTILFKQIPRTVYSSLMTAWNRISVAGGGAALRSGSGIHADEKRHVGSFEIAASEFANVPPEMPNPLPAFLIRLSARNEPPIEIKYTVQRADVNAGEISPAVQEVQL